MQETKLADDAFPHEEFHRLGYESVHHGQGRWNGVAIVSRVGIDDPLSGFGGDVEPDSDARILWATCAGIRIASAYVPNGRALDDAHYQYKLSWLARLHQVLSTSHSPTDELIVAGDWNIAPDDRDVWDPQAFVGLTHTSAAERNALALIEQWGLNDVFRMCHDESGLYSFWDYRGGDFHRRRGMRIDLIEATQPVAQRTQSVLIDRNARKGERPSDHAPVILDLVD